MEISQELISVVVLVLICVFLSICCMCIWMCRCRKDNIRASEERHDREVQLQEFEQEKAKNGVTQATLKLGNRLEISDVERSAHELRSHREDHQNSHRGSIGQQEERIPSGRAINNNQRPAGVAQRFRDEEAARNKRLDTISEMAVSSDSLQRNDSKTNVFNNLETRAGHTIEMDFNPGLSSSINLDKI